MILTLTFFSFCCIVSVFSKSLFFLENNILFVTKQLNMQKGCVFLEQYLILHAQSRDAVLQLVILMLQSQLLYLLFIITNVWTPHRQLLNKRYQRFNDQEPQKVLQQKLETLLLKDGKCINSNTWSMSTIIKVLWWGTRQWPAHTEHWYHSFYITNSFRIN